MEAVFLPSTFHKIQQTESFRIRTVFNAAYSAVSASLNTDFRLLELNEITLGYGEAVSVTLVPGHMNVILPLVGELLLEQKDFINRLEPGQLSAESAETTSVLNLKNYSKGGPSLFIQITYKNEFSLPVSQVHPVPIDHPNQQLHDIQISSGFLLSIGKFPGRFDYSFEIKKNEQIVAYVISGVFELEHRLMEAGDMMMLSGLDKNQIEFESLSVESILLVMKLKK